MTKEGTCSVNHIVQKMETPSNVWGSEGSIKQLSGACCEEGLHEWSMWGMCVHAGSGDTEPHNREERTPPITLALTKEAEAVVVVVVEGSCCAGVVIWLTWCTWVIHLVCTSRCSGKGNVLACLVVRESRSLDIIWVKSKTFISNLVNQFSRDHVVFSCLSLELFCWPWYSGAWESLWS